MSVFFRLYQHLLPRAHAWSIVTDKALRKFFLALAESPAALKAFVDGVWAEYYPTTTNHLSLWETQHGIFVNASDTTADRRTKIDGAWKAAGGQSQYYIESVLQNAGFDLYVHECWSQEGSGSSVLTNGSFEDVATGSPVGWAGVSDATVTAESGARTNGGGVYVCQVAIGIGDNFGSAVQAGVLTPGVTYRCWGWAKGNGANGYPRIWETSFIWDGDTADEWEFFDFEFTATGTDFYLSCYGDSATEDSAQFDDVRVAPVWIARDPGDYTDAPALGIYQCDPFVTEDQPQCSTGFDTSGGPTDGDPIFQWQCNDLLANDPHYLVNSNLTRRAPPGIPDDEDVWPYFIYIGPETLTPSTPALIPAYRRAELERLLLKHCPTQHWIVLAIDFINAGVFDESFDPSFE